MHYFVAHMYGLLFGELGFTRHETYEECVAHLKECEPPGPDDEWNYAILQQEGDGELVITEVYTYGYFDMVDDDFDWPVWPENALDQIFQPLEGS